MATLVTRVAPPPPPSSTAVTLLPRATSELNSSPRLPQPERTCVREALVALANWRLHCDGPGIPPPKCWTRAPNIERCCGKWVDINDEHYKDYPPVRTSREVQTGTTSWEWQWNPKTDNKGHREVILQTADEFNSGKTECKRWRAESEFEYLNFMETLEDYGLADADGSGKALDSSVPRYNPEGGGYYDNSNRPYPSVPDGPPIGW